MPQAYQGLSKEGCYMPLRLTESAQVWHGEHDEHSSVGVTALFGVTSEDTGLATLPNSATAVYDFPFEGLATCRYNDSAGTRYVRTGDVTSCLCNGIVGHVCMVNLDLTTRITLTYRYGFEIQVQPGSLLTPQQMISPMFDPDAIATYFRVSRELSDAYPEEFNSLGKIWDVIKRVADSVLPHIPYVGQVYTGIRDGVRALKGTPPSDRVVKTIEAAGNASLADKDMARAYLARPTSTVIRVKRSKAKRAPRRK